MNMREREESFHQHATPKHITINHHRSMSLYHECFGNLHANLPIDRRDFSRSPARHDSQGRRFPGRGRDEGRGGYAHDHRSSRRDDWEEYSYDGMYDDDHYRRDDRRDHGRMDGRRYGEREDYHHQGYDAAEGQYRRHRTRSRSAGSNGGPGEPSDTIVLEYVPFGIQPHEVCSLCNLRDAA